MVLNFSPKHSSCSLIAEAMRERNAWGLDDQIPRGRDGGWGESINGSTDPIELLPADPFSMGLTTTFTASFAACVGPGAGFEFSTDALVSRLNHLSYRDLPPSSSEPLLLFDRGVSRSKGPSDGAGEDPHEGLFFALAYLGVKDLLSVEMVCKSLHWAIRTDPLLWRCIHIDSPLTERITDDDLLPLTWRSQGSLQCLSLVGCARITDDGLKHVLESNPSLEKLSVSGCVRLSVEGLVSNLKAFKSLGNSGIKNLKLGRHFNVTQEHYEELKLLLDLDRVPEHKPHKLHFYHNDCSSLACEDDCVFDIEMCPRCQKLRLVYDCPAESCRNKEPDQCRACDVCIARCVHCGRCIKDREYMETFCLEYLCSGCWKVPLQCPAPVSLGK